MAKRPPGSVSSARSLAELLDKVGRFKTTEGFIIDVTIIDARNAYGRVQLLITPASGAGNCWVEASRVTVEPINEPVNGTVLDRFEESELAHRDYPNVVAAYKDTLT